MSSTKKILFLSGWYPNKTHLSVGSFVRSHAEAVNSKIKVDVFHVCGDENAKSIFNFEKTVVNGIDTYILYYRKLKSKHVFSQVIKALLYVFGQFYGYLKYRRLNAKPLFFHVHVLTRAAILPFAMKLFGRKIDYFITEHWSRYLPQDNSYKGFIRKFFTKKIVKKSKGVTAVSENLKYHMNRHGLVHRNFEVISNVTRDLFFGPTTVTIIKHNHFVHVSNFAKDCKNVVGILEAFDKLQENGYKFTLTMVGDGDDFELAKQKTRELKLMNVEFTGFLYGQDVLQKMSEATALILFSNYENQPVVITESLSLGIPVVATTVGGIPEMISKENGILVEPKGVEELKRAIKQIIDGEVNFDREAIKEEAAKKFKPTVIAHQFIEFYRAGGANI